jgi:hypothetical protein
MSAFLRVVIVEDVIESEHAVLFMVLDRMLRGRGAAGLRTLMDEPALEQQQSIHCITVHADPFDEA